MSRNTFGHMLSSCATARRWPGVESLLDLPGDTQREVAVWAATWCASAPTGVAYQSAGHVSLGLREADLVVAETLTPELGRLIVDWLQAQSANVEPYFACDAGRSCLFLRFSRVSMAVAFRMAFSCAHVAASHLPEEFGG